MPERRRLDIRSLHELSHSIEWHTPPVQRCFRELYEQEVGGEKLLEADVNDAWSFVGSISWEAMMRRDYAVAERELRRYLAHPEIEAVKPRHVQDLRVRLFLSVLAQGRETEGIAGLREVLANDVEDDPRIVPCMIRNGLGADTRVWCLTAVLKRRGLASEGLTCLVEDLAAMIRRCPRRHRRFPQRTSYAKLRRLLWKTLGKPRNPRGYRSPEEIIATAKRGVVQALREILAERAKSEGVR